MNTEHALIDTSIERLPPQSVESEQAVLGGLLVAGDAIQRVVDVVQPDYFYRRSHQLIFAAMLDLFEKNEPIDIVTVSQYLKDDGKLDLVGGRQYLTDLAMSVATTANLEYYARAVHEKSLLRNLIKAGTEIVAGCYEDADADQAIDHAEHLIFNLAQRRNLQQLVHIKDIVELSFAKIEERYENRDQLSGIPSGFYDLDALTSGFQRSDLIIVAARHASMGKCLSFDSEIVLQDGSISTIESLYKQQSARLLTLQDDYKLSWTEPSAFVDDGIKPVFKVTTRLGRSVETTLSHPFLTIQGWKKLQEIKVGDKIAVPRIIPAFGKETMRECEVKLLAYLIGDGCLSNGKVSFTNTNPAIQADFRNAVEDFGGVKSELCISGNRAPSFEIRRHAPLNSEHKVDFGNRVAAARKYKFGSSKQLARAVGVSPSLVCQWQQGKCAPQPELLYRLCSALDIERSELIPDSHLDVASNGRNAAISWIKELKLWGKTAHSKSIPEIIFKLPKPQLALFLNRLFSTDGWATRLASGQPQLGYATVSEALGRQIQHLLLRFGVIAKFRLRSVKYKGGRRKCWQLDITDQSSLKAFISEIGIFGKEKALANVESALLNRNQQTNCDLIPIEIWNEISKAKGTESWASLARRSELTCDSNIHVGKRAPSRGRLLALASRLDAKRLNDLATSDIYWDEIVSIESAGQKQVYDLTIPQTHNFVANDICVHNTAYCLNIAQHIAVEKNIPVAIFSLEMSREQLVQRMLCSEAGIDANRLRQGYLQNNDWNRLAMAMGRLGEAPVYIDDSAVISVLEIRAKARRLKAEMKDLGLIVIDYIQLMQGRKQTDNRVQEVSEISRGLKTLARELNVPVIALSQLSRAVEQRQNKRPMLSDLRESGCLSGDTLVYLPDEGIYRRIDSLVGKSGFNVLALNTETWQMELRPVTHAFSTGCKPVFKMTTRLGRTIRATANHKFLTIQGWQRLDELSAGTHIATPRRLTVPEKATMTSSELSLLGLLIGDGCTLARHSMQYTTADEDLAIHATTLSKEIFGTSITPRVARERNWYQVCFASSERLTHNRHNALAAWLMSLDAFDRRSYEKRVPDLVISQPAEEIGIFLSHLWATDGCLSMTGGSPAIYYSSSSRGLALDVQLLLLKLGITARVSRIAQNRKGRDQYHVEVSGKSDQEKFIASVGAVGKRKRLSLERIVEHHQARIANTNRDIIPRLAWRLLVDPAREVAGLTTREMQAAMQMSYCGTSLYKTHIGRQRAARVANVVNSPTLTLLSQSDVYWDEIISIDPDGEEEVYDLTVDGLHNFVANNITVHNSIEQDADIVMFIYRDEYYNPESEQRGEAEIIIAKQRNGPTGTVDLLFQSSITRFLNKVHNQHPNT